MDTEIKKHSAPDAHTSVKTNPSDVCPSSSMLAGPPIIASTANGRGQLSQAQILILERRKLNVELAVRLGWRNAGLSGIGEFIDIPYFRDGAEVNYKRRSLDGEKRFSQKAGGEQIFYNIDALKNIGEGTVVITEGEMDCLAALQCGFLAVSVPCGAPKEQITNSESSKYNFLADFPKSVKRVILATDSDSQGVNLMNDLAIRLGKHRCCWVKYPKGSKDLNDVLMNWGEKEVTKIISEAQLIRIEGLHRMDELPPIVLQPSHDVGIRGLEQHLRLRRGDLSVVTGIPSHGKSTFVNELAHNMARHHGWHSCLASFEMPPQTEQRRNLRTLYSQRPVELQTDDQLRQADEWINEFFSFIVPDDEVDEFSDIEWLKERMAAAVCRHNADLIVIDPWNEIDHEFDSRAQTMTQYVGRTIKDLKRFARRFNVHVMVIAHPAKMRKEKDGTYPVPTAYDISDSAHWYNKPDQVIVIHRDGDGVLVRIAKSRFHYALGKPGDVMMTWNDHDNRYYLKVAA